MVAGMRNATGKAGRQWDDYMEYYALADDARERKLPGWVIRGLLEQGAALEAETDEDEWA